MMKNPANIKIRYLRREEEKRRCLSLFPHDGKWKLTGAKVSLALVSSDSVPIFCILTQLHSIIWLSVTGSTVGVVIWQSLWQLPL